MAFTDPSPEYWDHYSNLQRVKHDLIREYLNGWFPILGSWAGRIIYFDTHAGRGTHASGQLGSPLVALDAILQHRFRDTVLANSEMDFYFVERDEGNASHLRKELQQRGELPERLHCQVLVADCFEHFSKLIESFRKGTEKIHPAFFFIDPYGFKVPGKILRDLMSFDRVELFINVMWRELDMALRQPDSMAETLNAVFDGNAWKSGINSDDYGERSNQAAELLRRITRTKWATHIRMPGDNEVTRYLLVHLTNHDKGRDLMKYCVWKICPDGGFLARKSDDPSQEYLIEPEPDLEPLRQWVLARLPARWSSLGSKLRATMWRDPHLAQVIKELRKSKIIDAQGYSGRFSAKADPELFTLDDRQEQ